VGQVPTPSRRGIRVSGGSVVAITLLVAMLAVVLIGAVVLWPAGSGGTGSQPSAGEKPPGSQTNVVLIVTDDQRWDSLFAMPHVRALMARGVNFTNAFVTTSYCCPSRASILTGQYSRHTGVYTDGGKTGGVIPFKDTNTLATWLHDAGYETALVGKYLNEYELIAPKIPPGWSEWDALASPFPATKYYDYTINQNGSMVHYGTSPDDYVDTVLQQRAVHFLKSTSEPFFLEFTPVAPHTPAIPAPRDRGRYANQALHPSDSYNEADVSDKPWAGMPEFPPLTAEDSTRLTKFWDSQLESLRQVDRSIGAFEKVLQDAGELDNTVFVFTSDNGLLLGEHRMTAVKVWPYEESIRVPLVVAGAGVANPGRQDDHLVLNIDLAPTIADLAGVTPGLKEDGRSLVPLLKDQDAPWREAFVVEYLGHGGHFDGFVAPFEGIRTRRYLYVRYGKLKLVPKGKLVRYPNGSEELYDLARDPFELHNLARVEEDQPLKHQLAAQLDRLLQS
jgi:N-acetylglucosamine-6-sulfatase